MNLEHAIDELVLDVLPRFQERFVKATYFGLETQRNPWDHWAYQEIIFATKPDVIIEVGVWYGGHLLALAHMLDAIGHGMIYGIDIDLSKVPDVVRSHPRIFLIEGAGAEEADAFGPCLPTDRVMVIEDSSHTYENTLAVLRAYADIVTPGCYLICEDSISNHPLPVGGLFPGPMEAIDAFLSEDPRYESDRNIEPLLTWNPRGYLRRTR